MYKYVADKLEELNYSSEISFGSSEKVLKNISIDTEETFVSFFLDINSEKTNVTNTALLPIIESIKLGKDSIVNFRRLNDIRNLNTFLAGVNKKLPFKGKFICCAETKEQRFFRLVNKFPKIFSYPYNVLDFIIKRIFPKWGPTRKIYLFLTNGNNVVMSMPEILGRLIYSGFKVNYLKEINGLTYFVTEKITKPSSAKPSYGVLFKMERVGKNGKSIYVYKIRTMHPYAEYLQKFMYDINNLKDGGKFSNDFRIARWGMVLRKLWIDELPMLYNWLKGDLKLVGLRPLSKQYLSLYKTKLVERRLKYKPGLVPPFYSDLPKTLDEIMESEEKYLDSYEKNPFKTDVKYFLKCFNNIVFKGARSS